MQTHVSIGASMLAGGSSALVRTAELIARSHHERWDGGGYPDARAGEAIPLAARIVCACDAWSAMTTDRSYRAARSDAEAAAELRACAGTHFDPRVVEALLAVVGR
jgi:putative two-component system response regulator